MEAPQSTLTHLECPECRKNFKADRVQTFCQDCRSSLLACYDLEVAKHTLRKEQVGDRPRGIWRWAGLKQLHQTGWTQPEETIVLFNTGSGIKYL